MLDRKEIKNILYDLRNISVMCDSLYISEIESLEEMIEENKYKVGVIGEFSSGKSTFLNALVGKRIFYSSNNEATGVITYLEGGNKKIASIFMDDGSEKELDLDDVNSLSILDGYCDIENKDNMVASVAITYPMTGFDKDIAFIDTPGLQGISLEQMRVTREILKEANATIVLITEKGLSETEIDILKGTNKEFGKINTKDIFVVINKIGLLHNGRSEEEALTKIESVKHSVLDTLKANGINDVKVFAVDSRDFLWSQDDDLYKEVQTNNNNKINHTLEQEEYQNRSKFIDFKRYLHGFLEDGQRNKNFLTDINNKISIMIEAYMEKLTQNEDDRLHIENSLIKQLHHQRELLIKNRRKLYNSLARYISNSFEEFIAKTEENIDVLVKERKKYTAHIVNEVLIDKLSINQENMNLCHEKVKDLIKKDAIEYEAKLAEYQHIMNKYFIKKRFSEDFKRIFNFNQKIDLALTNDIKDIKIDLNFKEIQNSDNNILQEIKKEIQVIGEEIKSLNEQIAKEIANHSKQKRMMLLNKRARVKKDFENEKKRMGKKPSPKQKYRKEARTKGFFIFKKTEYVDVPDGLDFSICKAWDKKIKKLMNIYINELENLDREIEDYDRKIASFNRKERELERLEIKRADLRLELKEAKEMLKIKMDRDVQQYLEDKKGDFYKILCKVEKDAYSEIMNSIRDNIEGFKITIKANIKSEIGSCIEAYTIELDNKLTDIKANMGMQEDEYTYIIDKLKEIGGMVV